MKVTVDRLVDSKDPDIEIEEFLGPCGNSLEISCGDQKIYIDNGNGYELNNLIKALKFFSHED